jgi:hypothetical protein
MNAKTLLVALTLAAQAGGLAASPSAGPEGTTPRLYIHLRGDQAQSPFLDAWQSDGITYISGEPESKAYRFSHESLQEIRLKAPALEAGWRGVLKYRQRQWWFLRFAQGPLPQDAVSVVYRYDAPTRQWVSGKPLEVRAANFEVLDDTHLLLLGLFSPGKNTYSLAGLASMDSASVDLLEEAPIKRYLAPYFWGSCLTSIDDQMAYAYFPHSGHLFGFDRTTHAFRAFKTPWTPITDESIDRALTEARAAKKRDCFIEAIDHPGAEHAYFMPMSSGRMAFVYKVIDREMEGRMVPKPDGTRSVIERTGAMMLSADAPEMLIELDPPTRLHLDRWCWSPSAGRFVSFESRLVTGKPSQAAPKR